MERRHWPSPGTHRGQEEMPGGISIQRAASGLTCSGVQPRTSPAAQPWWGGWLLPPSASVPSSGGLPSTALALEWVGVPAMAPLHSVVMPSRAATAAPGVFGQL